ncbi:MAG: hypothetical protein AAF915_24260 [Cyanobacteria bacterium P01_D01_bin.50]
MQQIIDLVASLKSGESKKYSLLRIAIANYLGDEFTFNYDIRTSEGKQKLLYLANRLIEEEEGIGEELSEATQDNETAETIHPEAVQIIEPVKETFISRSSPSLDRAGAWDEMKVWQIIPKHRVLEPINNGDVQIRTFTQLKPGHIEQEFNSRALENSEYARINGHGVYPPPQAIEHHYFTNMDTQSLFELETIEQRLNDLIAEAPDITIKGRLNNALEQISTTLDEAFKDA